MSYVTAALVQATERLDRLVPETDTWPVPFARDVLQIALSSIGVSMDLASALLSDLGRVSSSATERVKSVHAALADLATALVPHVRATGTASGIVASPGIRDDVFAALAGAARGWDEVEAASLDRALFDLISGAYRRERDRLTEKMSELGQALGEVQIPVAVPPAPGPKKALPLLGIALVGVGASALAIWWGRRLG